MNPDATTPSYLRLPYLLLLAAISGGLLCLAFPPVNLGPLAWIALVPLFFALSQTRSIPQGGLCGLVFGLAFFGGLLQYFTMWGSVIPWFAAALYQALYMGVFGLIAGPVMRRESPAWRTLGCAAAWTLVAFGRAYAGSIAYNGGDLAFTQYDQLPLLQVVSLVGQMGLTFAVALVNTALSQALLGVLPMPLWRAPGDVKEWGRRAARVAVACYCVMFAAYFWGALVLKSQHTEQGRKLRVAIVQGNVPLHTPVTDADVQASRERYLALTKTVAEDTDLTLWPESALPSYMPLYPGLEDTAREAARATRGQLLLGTLEVLQGEYYNAARLYDNLGRVTDRYHKMDLVVYGEYVPFRDRLAFLKRFPIRENDLTAGAVRKVFTVRGVKVAPLICFEGMFSRPSLQVCRLGAQVIAIITSDAWAQGTAEVAQHSCTASMRAVESRRYVCRAASSGQTAVYSPYGELLGGIPIGGQGVLPDTVYARDGLSVYHRIGDLPIALVCLALYCCAFSPRPRRSA